MFDLNLIAYEPESAATVAGEVYRRRQRMRLVDKEPSDPELVEVYHQAVDQDGPNSEAAGVAFEPIFRRFWPYVYSLATVKLGTLYAEELAAETMMTVLERLNGKEVVTNLKGLVRHSFEREYATLLEKLFQGRKLMRAGVTTVDPETSSGKVKGASIVSLNVSANASESDDLDMLNLLNDPDADVVEAAARRELVRVLHGLIAEMPAQYRAPLVCQWLMGMRIKEVATELNLTIDQVKHNTARGIKWLQKRMPGSPDDWML